MKYERVHGLYGTKWKGVDPRSTRHPAKFSYKLIQWIVTTGLERGWWDKDTLILDPFAGVGLGGVVCSMYGVPWLGVELEDTFVEIGRANLVGCPRATLIQGDSRDLTLLLDEYVGGCITSPPFSQPETRDRHAVQEGSVGDAITRAATVDRQGVDPRNLSRLSIGALTSPPYGNRVDDSGTGPIAATIGKYGESEGQVGNLRTGGITSPPFMNSDNRGGTKMPEGYFDRVGGVRTQDDVVPSSTGQVGNIADEDYWGAVGTIYKQVYNVLSVGSVFTLVVKAFVKKGELVDLPNLTGQLLTDIGFTPEVYVDAMLVSEDGTKEYKSFFRRLAERKGSPRIDSEVVLVVRK